MACLVAFVVSPRLLALDPSKALTQYVLTSWQIEDGLPQNSIYAMLQTRDGYLWLGTEEGVVRFDGVRFTVFDKRNTDQLRHNWIQSLVETRDGSLWLAIVGGGLVRYSKGAFTSYSTSEGLASNAVWALAEDRDGALWIATDGGLHRYRDAQFMTLGEVEGLTSKQLRSLYVARDGTLWVGTDGDGLFHLEGGRFTRLSTETGLSSNVVWALRETADGSLWVGTAGGLDRLRDGAIMKYGRDDGLPDQYIRALYVDRHDTLWIGTGAGGIARFREGVFSSLGERQGLFSGDIRSFCEDGEGNVWVGTSGGGLARLRDGKFTMFGAPEGLFGDVVRAVIQDRDGSMWIGGRGGVSRLGLGRVETFRHEDGIVGETVLSLHEDRDGSIWLGTEAGLTRARGGRFDSFTTRAGLPHDTVRAIVEDRDGSLWVGTEGGIAVKTGERDFRSYTTKDGLSNDGVVSLHAARDGSLWIGTRQGLTRFVEGALRSFTGPLGTAPVISIHEDSAGTMWIATGAVGLFRISNGRIDSITSKHGLYDDTLMQTLEDDSGNIWAGSNRGIVRMSKRELEEVAAGTRRLIQPTVYGTADGLRSPECNGATQPAGFRSADGRLWFSTIRGVAVIDPASYPRNVIPPPVVIERVTARGRVHAAATPQLQLPAGFNNLQIDYTALSFSVPERVRFRYKLEGFDPDWIDAGDRRTAFYTNVPAGAYRFRVLASNEDGVSNDVGSMLALAIAPRFHETTAFRFFLVVLVVASIWAIDRARAWRVHSRERQLSALVAERTRSLEAALADAERSHRDAEHNRIDAERASRAKSVFLASMSHELRTPMNSIIGFSEILTHRLEGAIDPKLHNFLTLVRTSSQHLLAIINDILDLSKVEMGKMEVFAEAIPVGNVIESVVQVISAVSSSAGVTIEIDVDPELPPIETDPGKLKQILYNLLSNAVKFSPAGSCVVVRSRIADGDRVEISVSDEGVGIAPGDMDKVFEEFRQLGHGRNAQIGTGLGLSLVRRFTELLRGTVRVESELAKGTTFIVTLPVRYSEQAAPAIPPMQGAATVMVIDDDDTEWEELGTRLEAAGFAPRRARTGGEALAWMKRGAPSAAILNLALRGGEGWEVFRALRKDGVPVIVTTSADDSHPATELSSAVVLIKPVRPELIVERLQRIVRPGSAIGS